MSRKLARLAMIAVGLVSCWQVQAQQNIPIQHDYYIGDGDVELNTGTFAYHNNDISIGPQGQGFTFTRYFGFHQQADAYARFGSNTGHNFEIALYRKSYHEPLDPPSVFHYEFHVIIGAVDARIDYSNLAEGPGGLAEQDASTTLVSSNGIYGPFVYTREDGTIIEFPAISDSILCPQLGFGSPKCTRASAITFPNGERQSLTYEQIGFNQRLRTVISTRGYGLGLDYATTSDGTIRRVCVVNLAVQYMAPAGPCPSGARAATYSYSSPTGVIVMDGFTDATNATTSYFYDSSGPWVMAGIRNPGSTSNDLTLNYYPSLKVSSEVYADGSTWTYSYQKTAAWDTEAENEWTIVTDPLSHATRHDFLSGCSPKPHLITDPLNRQTQFTCASSEYPIRQTTPEGNYTEYTYDSRHNRTQMRLAAKSGSGLSDRLVQSSFPSNCANRFTCNKLDYVIDARGNRTDYTYSATHGGVLTETGPAPVPGGVRPQKRYTYAQLYAWYKNASGTLVQAPTPIWLLTEISECQTLVSCAGTSDEVLTTYAYGTSGVANNLLVTSKTVHAGDNSLSTTTTWTYDDWGNQLSEDGPLAGSGDTSYTRYDADSRVVGIISPDPDGAGPLPRRATRNTYDAAGRLTTVETGTVTGLSDTEWTAFTSLQTTTTTYDVVGRPIKTTVSAGGTTYRVSQTSYDGAWRSDCTAVRMDPAQWASQSNACVPQSTGPNGPDRISKNIYDAVSQLTKVQRAYGTPLQQDYATYTYSSNSKMTSVTDANGNRSEMTFDGFDREARLYFPSKTTPGQASSADYEQYGYDENDNRTSLRKRDGQTILYSYDAINRMSFKDIPNGSSADVYYGYDLRGLRTFARFGSASASAPGITNVFDALGRIGSTTNSTGGVGRTLAYQYDGRGNRTRLTFPDGNYFTYVYDGLDRMTAILENGTTNVVGLTYNASGQRSTLTGAITTSYTYDADSRLSSLTHDLAGTGQDVSYSFTQYNPASQVLIRTLTNESYAWASAANVTRTYSSNGLNQYTNVGSVTLNYDANGNLASYAGAMLAYDVENRLVSASGAKSAALSYDPLGRLFQTSGAAAGATQFLYDGDALVAEYDATGALKRRYVHGPGIDSPVLWYEGAAVSSATRRALRSDYQGTIVAIADSAGSSLSVNRYDEYGTPAATNLGRFAYTGQIAVPELAMYYYKARFYDPSLGRFLQTDPVGYQDDVNLYSYVGNDPANRFDPTGTSCTTSVDEKGRTRADSCKIDTDREKLVKKYGEKAVAKMESAYKAAVNDLLARADAEDNITVDTTDASGNRTGGTTSAEVRAGDIAANLIKREVGYNPSTSRMMETSSVDSNKMWIGEGIGKLLGPSISDPESWFRNSDKSLMVAWTHEGMHSPGVHEQLGPRGTWERFHDTPYDQTAFRLLGLTYP